MNNQSVFNPTECELLLQLLERERSELPVEIRHSGIPDAKEHLRHRLHDIDQLIAKMRMLPAAAYKMPN